MQATSLNAAQGPSLIYITSESNTSIFQRIPLRIASITIIVISTTLIFIYYLETIIPATPSEAALAAANAGIGLDFSSESVYN